MVEQPAVNRRVTGSSPVSGANSLHMPDLAQFVPSLSSELAQFAERKRPLWLNYVTSQLGTIRLNVLVFLVSHTKSASV